MGKRDQIDSTYRVIFRGATEYFCYMSALMFLVFSIMSCFHDQQVVILFFCI
jgi:hypothetical protein